MTARGRRVVIVLAAAGLLLAGIGAYLRQFVTPLLVAGPMVQMVGPEGFTVVWQTALAAPGDVVLLKDGKARRVFSTIEHGQHVARVDGLEPDTIYRYSVRHERVLRSPEELASATVRTAPDSEAPLSFLVFGDSGSGSNSQWRLAGYMLDYRPNFVIHTGDLIYPGGELEGYRERFFEPYADLIRTVPFYPSLGNHDVKTGNGDPLLKTFVLPENGPPGIEPERCYSFDYGQARFVAIDSTLTWAALGQLVAPWLVEVLDQSEATWEFAFFHHPPYTNSKHDPDAKIQQTIVPALEQAGVDLAFCGHNHLYERTHPIREGGIAPPGQGVVYVVSGAGGASKYAEREQPLEYIAAYSHDAFSFTAVDIEGLALRLRQIDIRGRTIDDWTYTKPATTAQADTTMLPANTP